jgi:hypothetical protein
MVYFLSGGVVYFYSALDKPVLIQNIRRFDVFAEIIVNFPGEGVDTKPCDFVQAFVTAMFEVTFRPVSALFESPKPHILVQQLDLKDDVFASKL